MKPHTLLVQLLALGAAQATLIEQPLQLFQASTAACALLHQSEQQRAAAASNALTQSQTSCWHLLSLKLHSRAHCRAGWSLCSVAPPLTRRGVQTS